MPLRCGGKSRSAERFPQKKWGPALLPAPTAPSEGYAGIRLTLDPAPENRFVTPLLVPGSPAQASHPTELLPLARSRSTYSTARPEGPLVFRPVRPVFGNRGPSKPKPSSVPRPFLGRPLSRSASLTEGPRTIRNRVALEEEDSSGASSRLAPKCTEALSTACRRRSDLWSPAAPPAVSSSWRGRDRRPDHPSNMHPSPESRKRKMTRWSCE
jgi:hypothetical protein